ncbi:hypothetical protein [Glycomyces sp. NPDC048151]|uniref:hypothetical protein n=1 Tax=Glycomyces sp. NPDC048151 TaxID=3364002 RepID=UPI00371FCA71
MTAAPNYPSEPPMGLNPAPYQPQPQAVRRRGPSLVTWRLIAMCLLVWPAVFATVVIGTFLVAAILYNDPGGPLFWPLGWILSGVIYSLVVGIPLAICAHRRHWAVRYIPAVAPAVGLISLSTLLGAWVVPAAAAVTLSIIVETTRRPKPKPE